MASPSIAIDQARAKKKGGVNVMQRREIRWGLLFLSPWIVGFLIFTLFPTLASFAFSFTNYNPIQAELTEFVGLRNYARLFTDPFLRQAIGVTLKFTLISVPFALLVPLGLALLVNSDSLRGKNFYRALFYMPSMIPVVVNVMVWRGIMNSESGWLNKALAWVGIEGPNWFQDEAWVLPALMMMGVWGVSKAVNNMLADLQNLQKKM